MIFEDLILENKSAFLEKVENIALFLGINPDWLMFIMWFETGRTLNPKTVNSVTRATGLIQFMPSTAIGLGTTVELLAQMSNLQQLDFVKKYFTPYQNKMHEFTDAYLVVFFPMAIGQSDDYVLQTNHLHPDVIAKQNPIFDLNKDMRITKGEIKTRLLGMVPEEYRESFTHANILIG